MYKVMIRDNMSPLAKDILEATGKIEVVVDLSVPVRVVLLHESLFHLLSVGSLALTAFFRGVVHGLS